MYLDEILENKREEVRRAKLRAPLQEVIGRAETCLPTRPFLAALRRSDGKTALIAEVKKASPSAGVILEKFDPVTIAREYASAGADCISVLTDEKYFQGHLSFLAKIKDAVGSPLLCKDFIIDEYQVYEARAAGADAILLIVAALDEKALSDLYRLARMLGLDVLVETHTEAEMETAARLQAALIGINSRDLTRFVTDISIIERVAKVAPDSALLVGESGIKTRADVDRLRRAGVHAILVGETLMRSTSIADSIKALID